MPVLRRFVSPVYSLCSSSASVLLACSNSGSRARNADGAVLLGEPFLCSERSLVQPEEHMAFRRRGKLQPEPRKQVLAEELEEHHEREKEGHQVDEGEGYHVRFVGVHVVAHFDEVGMQEKHVERGDERADAEREQ